MRQHAGGVMLEKAQADCSVAYWRDMSGKAWLRGVSHGTQVRAARDFRNPVAFAIAHCIMGPSGRRSSEVCR
jgi:hypothetical protein